MTIDWAAFTWEAFATIFVGLAAVIGAVRVGNKQIKLLDHQRLQAETNLRIQLLDRRAACISQMRDVESEWTREARLSPEKWTQFRNAYWEAQLLFSKSLVAEMDVALSGLMWGPHWQRRAMYYHERGNTPKADEKLEMSFSEDDKVFKVMPNLLEKLVAESRVADWI